MPDEFIKLPSTMLIQHCVSYAVKIIRSSNFDPIEAYKIENYKK